MLLTLDDTLRQRSGCLICRKVPWARYKPDGILGAENDNAHNFDGLPEPVVATAAQAGYTFQDERNAADDNEHQHSACPEPSLEARERVICPEPNFLTPCLVCPHRSLAFTNLVEQTCKTIRQASARPRPRCRGLSPRSQYHNSTLRGAPPHRHVDCRTSTSSSSL